MVPVLEDLFIEGGLVETGKQRKEGWGLTGASVGIWGWATVEHPPKVRPVMPSRISLFFFQGAGANLSTSTNTLCLPHPRHPHVHPPFTVGAFLWRDGDVFKCPLYSKYVN